MAQIPTVKQPEVQRQELGLQGYRGMPTNANLLDYSPMIRAGAELGHAVGQTGQNIARNIQTALPVIGAVTVHKENQQRANDAYNAGQVELAQQEAYGAAEQKMRDTPNDYGKFKTYADDADKTFKDKSASYLEQIAPDRRRFIQQQAEARALDFRMRVDRISSHAQVTEIYNGFKNQIEQGALRGDTDFATRKLQEAQSLPVKVFSDSEAQALQMDIGRRAEYGAIQREIESGKGNIVEQLQAVDDKGTPVNYKQINESDRNALVRYAEHKRALSEAGMMDQVYSDMLSGKQVSETNIDSLYQLGQIRLEQKNHLTKMVRDFNDSATRQQTQEQQKQAAFSRDALELQIMEHKFSLDPAKRAAEIADYKTKIYDQFAGQQPAMAKSLITQLQSSVDAVENEKSYKKTAAYNYAMDRLDTIKKDLWSTTDRHGFMWMRYADKDSAPAINYGQFKIKLDDYIRRNPDANEKQINEFIDNTKQQINATHVSNLLDKWKSIGVEPQSNADLLKKTQDTQKSSGELRMHTPDGKTAVFDSNRKFLRYE